MIIAYFSKILIKLKIGIIYIKLQMKSAILLIFLLYASYARNLQAEIIFDPSLANAYIFVYLDLY